jgi:chaperone BCS1
MLKNNYLEMIEQKRHNKTFIYNLCKTTFENDKYECWNEMEFESTRTFRNMFFEGKDEIIKKIEFFMNNKQWYYENGIPYSLGIGLHGPPGTGKTSFFKCLSNMTNRHIVIISLKLIKTKSQLDQFFFENEYTEHNKKHKIGFDKKIIIFEDIDCMGDIVLKRSRKKTIEPTKNDNINTVIHKIANQTDTVTTEIKLQEDPITLDDILNLWDGLKETPGRILGISSNHYELLDPALVRPGRIDITLKLDNVSHDILRKMHLQYYNTNIDEEKLKTYILIFLFFTNSNLIVRLI